MRVNLKSIAIVAAAGIGLSGCAGMTTGQKLAIAAAYTTGACTLVNIGTGAAVTYQEMTLPTDAPASSVALLNKLKAGQAISSTQCMQVAQALQATGQQVMAAEQAGAATK